MTFPRSAIDESVCRMKEAWGKLMLHHCDIFLGLMEQRRHGRLLFSVSASALTRSLNCVHTFPETEQTELDCISLYSSRYIYSTITVLPVLDYCVYWHRSHAPPSAAVFGHRSRLLACPVGLLWVSCLSVMSACKLLLLFLTACGSTRTH